MSYLNNGRVLWQRICGFGGLTNGKVLDITPPEDDVLEDFISWRNGPVSGAVFSAKRTDCTGKLQK